MFGELMKPLNGMAEPLERKSQVLDHIAKMSGRDLHSVQQARKLVEQLRRERNIRRGLVSQSANDLVRYTQEFEKEDILVTGFANDKMNPYRAKSSFQCMLF